MRTKPIAFISLALLTLLMVSRQAMAQETAEPLTTDSERPPVTPATEKRRLDLGLSLYDAFDMASMTNVQGIFLADPFLNGRVGFGGANATLVYTQTGKDNTFGATGASGLRYYSVAGSPTPVDYYGGLNFSTRVSKRIRLSGSETASRSPYYAFGAAPLMGNLPQEIGPQFDQTVNRLDAGQLPLMFDQAVNGVDTVSSYTTAGLTWTLDRRSSFNAGYVFDYMDAGAAFYHVHTMGASGSYQRQVSRYMNIRAGYGFYRSQLYGVRVPYYDSHNIDAGLGYRRPLSFSRRSTVGFNVGSTMITDGFTRSFYVTGDASLLHQLSQFWLLAVSYNRSVSTIGGVATPYVTDLGAVSVGGRVTRYLSLSGNGSFSRGTAAAFVSNTYDSAFASGRVGYQLARYLPLYAEYVYYFYQFDQTFGLAPGFPIRENRNGLRVGLSYSIPLIGRRLTR